MDYQKQAEDFLYRHGISIQYEFLKFGKHFPDDEQARNIFNVTLSRNDKSFSVRFGDSIQNSCKPTAFKMIDSNEKVDIFWGVKIGKVTKYMLTHKIYTSYPVLKKIYNHELDAKSLIDDNAVAKEMADYQSHCKKLKINLHWELNTLDKLIELIERKINAKIEEANKPSEKLIDQKTPIETPDAYSILSCLTKYDPGTFENFCADMGLDTDSRRAERTYNAVVKEWADVSGFFTETELEELSEIN